MILYQQQKPSIRPDARRAADPATAVGEIRRWIRLLPLAAVLAAVVGGSVPAVSKDLVPEPELDVSWTYRCQGRGEAESLKLTPRSIENGAVVVDLATPKGDEVMSLSTRTWFIGFIDKLTTAKGTRDRVIDWGSLVFEKLAVGEKVTAWVRQSDPQWGINRWNWQASIKEKKSVETSDFGALEVYVIEQYAYTEEWQYATRMTLHYSPKLNFITYWKESDSNDWAHECRLLTRE